MVMVEERVRSNSWIDRLVVCKDCKHVAMDQKRNLQHLKEARHINSLRNMAYRYTMSCRVFHQNKVFTYLSVPEGPY